MKKEQVFVRAINKEGKWDSIDVLDLDDRSFKAFVIEKFKQHEMVSAIKDEYCDGEQIELKEGR